MLSWQGLEGQYFVELWEAGRDLARTRLTWLSDRQFPDNLPFGQPKISMGNFQFLSFSRNPSSMAWLKCELANLAQEAIKYSLYEDLK